MSTGRQQRSGAREVLRAMRTQHASTAAAADQATARVCDQQTTDALETHLQKRAGVRVSSSGVKKLLLTPYWAGLYSRGGRSTGRPRPVWKGNGREMEPSP
jgi:hypothetical protein